MSRSYLRWPALTLAIGTLTVLLSACVPIGGYGYDDGGGYGAGYYEPYGAVYGGWGDDYRVGPYRGGYHRQNFGRSSGHTYRSAPSSRSMPSLPSRSRSGGSRSGGSHSGGGRSGGSRSR